MANCSCYCEFVVTERGAATTNLIMDALRAGAVGVGCWPRLGVAGVGVAACQASKLHSSPWHVLWQAALPGR